MKNAPWDTHGGDADSARLFRKRMNLAVSHTRRHGTACAPAEGMDDRELKAQLDTIIARCAELEQLVLTEAERTRKHLDLTDKVQKVVLTEVRGLATKVDRLTRLRRGILIPNP